MVIDDIKPFFDIVSFETYFSIVFTNGFLVFIVKLNVYEE